jgi:hypothetical protein
MFDMVEGIKNDYDFGLFSQQEGLIAPGKQFVELLPKFEEGSVPNTLEEYTSKSVIRVGELELSGLMRWKKYIFVLTRYGYLHFFDTKDVRKVLFQH